MPRSRGSATPRTTLTGGFRWDPVGIVGAGAMGVGIAQVAATAGHPVVLVDAVPGSRRGRARAAPGALDRLVARGRLDPRRTPTAAADRVRAVDEVTDLPECALVVEAVPEDLDAQAGGLRAALAAHQPAEHPSRDEHLEHRRDRDRRRRDRPRARARPALLQPAAGHAPRRGGPRRGDLARDRGPRGDPHGRVGQDARAVRLDAGVHRQPGGPAVLRRGAAGRRERARRRRDGRLDPPRARGLPDGPARAHRPHRPGRQPRRRHLRLGADRPRRALRTHRLSSAASSPTGGSVARPERGVYAYAADGTPEPCRARPRARRPARRRSGRHRPARPDAGDARQRGRRPRGARRGVRRRRRHGDAARAPATRRGPSSGAARSVSTSSPRSCSSSTPPTPGGRYRPSPALTDGSLG